MRTFVCFFSVYVFTEAYPLARVPRSLTAISILVGIVMAVLQDAKDLRGTK